MAGFCIRRRSLDPDTDPDILPVRAYRSFRVEVHCSDLPRPLISDFRTPNPPNESNGLAVISGKHLSVSQAATEIPPDSDGPVVHQPGPENDN